MTLIYDNEEITKKGGLSLNGVWQPLSYYEQLSDAERTALGITKKADPVTPAPTLEQVYQSKVQEISQERTAASNGTFTHDGKTFSANTLAKESILSTHGEVLATNAMPTGWIGAWLDASGKPYPIASVAQWKAFYNSYYNTGLALAGKAAQLQGQIAAIYNDGRKSESTKINEINEITW